MLFGAGLSVGLAFWGVIAATGLGATLKASAHGLTLLKLLGGFYLLWMAYGAARSARRRQDPALPVWPMVPGSDVA
ncbi:LysE family transporter [Actibacterium sp. 188UL27-1]|uniref:LysE family transporter n=1 Tax=Actibacterium sp. 188UL27-1 TaxID=2786961 RepID=UPI00195D8C0C|nr:LysE family transporter [Actibacterium sp. 188UL27-1]